MSEFECYAGLLRVNSVFRDDGSDVQIEYRTDADDRPYLKRYGIFEIAGSGSDLDRAVRLLLWVSSHTVHNGNFDNHIAPTAPDLLDYALDGGAAHGINCRSLAILLTELLLACGIRARTVYLFPMSPYDCDNHVVTECYAADRGKWVMLDPTFGLYLSRNGEPMSIAEIRAALADRVRPAVNREAHYNNNNNSNPVDADAIFSYYAKDFYRFQVLTQQAPGSETAGTATGVNILPEGYDLIASVLANGTYRGSIPPEQYAEAEQALRNAPIIYKGLQFLYGEE